MIVLPEELGGWVILYALYASRVQKFTTTFLPGVMSACLDLPPTSLSCNPACFCVRTHTHSHTHFVTCSSLISLDLQLNLSHGTYISCDSHIVICASRASVTWNSFIRYNLINSYNFCQ